MNIRVFLVVFLATSVAWARNCIERRGALDIGSGTTKAYAAVVDTCQGKIVETLYDKQMPISFAEAIAKSERGEISEELIEKATGEINALIKSMREKKVERISAIATSAFRTAKNGARAAVELSKRTKIPVTVLSQDEEAEVGALSARARGGIPANDTTSIVWDIGGGSMQMWARTESGVQIFRGDLASVSFKNKVIREIQNRDPHKFTSPNPLGKDYERAVKLAADHARTHVPEYFKKVATTSRWLGIGGVLSLSIRYQVDPSSPVFSRADLEKTLRERSKLTDAEIENPYRETEISNLALVLGYMQELGIDRVETLDVSLAQGWLLH